MRYRLAVFAFVLAFVLAWVIVVPQVAVAANVAVLMPGSAGAVPIDFLIRNQGRLEQAGIRTIVTTTPSAAAAAIAAEASQGRKAVLVGMSRGTLDAAGALASGAKAAGVVFVSGMYPRVIATLGSPDKLPPTLVVHHARDACQFTKPDGARGFVGWAQGKARVQWINTTGPPGPNPCGAIDAHGFYKQDGPAMAAIIAFIRSR